MDFGPAFMDYFFNVELTCTCVCVWKKHVQDALVKKEVLFI